MFPAVSLPECVADMPEWNDLIDQLESIPSRIGASERDTDVEFRVRCEICESKPATIYCGQDKAHLCAGCDETHHSSSKLLAKHGRLPVYHSPFQFGFCKEHTADKYECVCLECGEMLCQLCLLVGSHAGKNDHPIVSTIEAFRLSLTPPGGDTGDILQGKLAQTFFAVQEKHKGMVEELKLKHTLVVQAESNHWQIQQMLDKELRGVLETLEKQRRKRIDFIHALRRENLLILTTIEWFEAFVVHARLSLPPSLWLRFFHSVSLDAMKELLLNSTDGSTIAPIDTVAAYIQSLPSWVTNRVEVHGHIDVFADSLNRQRLASSLTGTTLTTKPVIHSQFEWVPPPVLPEEPKTALSPEQLRKNRMTTRLEELLSQPQESGPGPRAGKLSIPFPSTLTSNPVPLDNVKDFVMQTLAVLAESEARIPNLNFAVDPIPEPVPVAPAPQTVVQAPPPVVHAPTVVSADAKPADDKPVSSIALQPPPQEPSTQRLRRLLSSGPQPYGNAVSIITAAPSAERQELIKLFSSLFLDANGSQLEEMVRAIVKETVNSIESPSFLISGVSMLVPLTATFMLSLYPQDSTFMDPLLSQLMAKVSVDGPSHSETAVAQFLSLISAPSTSLTFPPSLTYLLRCIHTACVTRFSGPIAIGVISGLFLARVVCPRLVWAAPKTAGDTHASQAITLMTRYVHRVAGAAAEGRTALSRTDDPMAAAINAVIGQVNSLVMREVVGAPALDQLPPVTGAVPPMAAAETIERKVREYGQGIVY